MEKFLLVNTYALAKEFGYDLNEITITFVNLPNSMKDVVMGTQKVPLITEEGKTVCPESSLVICYNLGILQNVLLQNHLRVDSLESIAVLWSTLAKTFRYVVLSNGQISEDEFIPPTAFDYVFNGQKILQEIIDHFTNSNLSGQTLKQQIDINFISGYIASKIILQTNWQAPFDFRQLASLIKNTKRSNLRELEKLE